MKPAITQRDGTKNTSGKDVFNFFAQGKQNTSKFLSYRAMSSREMRRAAKKRERKRKSPTSGATLTGQATS